jgi:hypothetical protein
MSNGASIFIGATSFGVRSPAPVALQLWTARQGRIAGIVRLDGKAVLFQMLDPIRATAAVEALVDLDYGLLLTRRKRQRKTGDRRCQDCSPALHLDPFSK